MRYGSEPRRKPAPTKMPGFAAQRRGLRRQDARVPQAQCTPPARAAGGRLGRLSGRRAPPAGRPAETAGRSSPTSVSRLDKNLEMVFEAEERRHARAVPDQRIEG